MSICVIFNPAARGEKARGFREALARQAHACVLKPTAAPLHAIQLAAQAVEDGCETIVAAGGDGTVNEVANGIALAVDGLARARLGILPLGTINVFAIELGLPSRLDWAWQIIQAGRETRVDLPYAEMNAAGGAVARRWFVQLAGAGLDARAIAAVDWTWKKRVGPLAYAWAGLKTLRGPQPQVRVEAASFRGSGELVLIGNGRFYGGKVPMFPQAELRNGRFEVRVFPRVTWLTLLRFGWAWLSQRPLAGEKEIRFAAESLTLRADTAMPFELDGDNVGQLPVRFALQPQALRVVVP